MRKRRVLHLLDTAQVEWTGIVRIVAALAEHIDTDRYELHAWFFRDHGPLQAILEKSGMHVRVIDWNDGIRDPRGLWRFVRFIRKEKFAIVHQHFGGSWVRRISRHVGGARVIAHLHSDINEKDWKVPVRCNVVGADLVIATSEAVARWSGVDAEVVYPGVTIPHEQTGRIRSGHVLGAAGRLVPLKGLDYLVRALGEVRAIVPDVELEIAGTGPEEVALRREVFRLGLNDCVRFLGWQETIPFQRWNVFVMPSLAEAFGVAALEAMANGLPVVASAVGGLPELVQGGVTGWLVPPADTPALVSALTSLLLNSQRQLEMAAAASERARKFTTARMCEDLERLYNRLFE